MERKEVQYLHYGAQCPGYRHMGSGARGLARALGRDFRQIDVQQDPESAARHGMFFPGMVVVGDFRLVYPGSVQQMLESYRRRGPIEGDLAWRAAPPGSVDSVVPLRAERAAEAAGVCLGSAALRPGVKDKMKWLAREGETLADGVGGFLGKNGTVPAGGVEFVRETRIPYPVPTRREGWIFITCLYSSPEADCDYRPAMLQHLVRGARDLGYRGISAVTGEETPYPNGPRATFSRTGFAAGPVLGRALLRNRWEQMRLMQLELIPGCGADG